MLRGKKRYSQHTQPTIRYMSQLMHTRMERSKRENAEDTNRRNEKHAVKSICEPELQWQEAFSLQNDDENNKREEYYVGLCSNVDVRCMHTRATYSFRSFSHSLRSGHAFSVSINDKEHNFLHVRRFVLSAFYLFTSSSSSYFTTTSHYRRVRETRDEREREEEKNEKQFILSAEPRLWDAMMGF